MKLIIDVKLNLFWKRKPWLWDFFTVWNIEALSYDLINLPAAIKLLLQSPRYNFTLFDA